MFSHQDFQRHIHRQYDRANAQAARARGFGVAEVTSKRMDQFVAYVGDPDFHDGYIKGVVIEEGKVQVTVEGYSGRLYTASFAGVETVSLNSPIGMELYALSEMQAAPPLRKFIFLNSDDDGVSALSVTARELLLHSR